MKVELTYFKPRTGKYYSSGSYETQLPDLYKIWDEVQEKRVKGELPDIHGSEWTILVNVPEHEFAHPKLLPYFVVELFDDRFNPLEKLYRRI